MGDAIAGCVAELDPPREWWAARGEGAFRDGERLPRLEPGPLELVGLETARPDALAANAERIGALGAERVRALGSVAVTLCLVAAGELDAMISLREVRSVDAAAGQLIVREAGGSVSFPADDSLGLDMRSRVAAARDDATLGLLLAHFAAD
jgi:myo-inositol-1(or 4)-monophosphatase